MSALSRVRTSARYNNTKQRTVTNATLAARTAQNSAKFSSMSVGILVDAGQRRLVEMFRKSSAYRGQTKEESVGTFAYGAGFLCITEEVACDRFCPCALLSCSCS